VAVVVNGTPAVTTFAAVASGSATMPAGVTTGELLTLDFAQAFDVGITTPSGWTPIIAAGDGFAATRGASFYRIADGSEGASLALTFGGSCDAVAIITRHGGFNSAAPINGTPQSGSGTSGSTTAITSPSVTTTVDGCLIRRVAESRQSAGIATPSGQTDGGTGTTGSGGTNSTSRATYSTQATAGATGTVTFTSAAGGDREWVSLTYAIAPSPGPTITGQPSDQTVNAGSTATFSVTATGATSYQWKKNGTNVSGGSGGTTASYTTPAVSYSDQGAQYTCDCINGGGTTTSSAATLRVAWNLSGTGPRAYPSLGHPFGAGTVGSWLRGANAGGPPSHGTTGALSADFATVSGTAAHSTLHSTSGALGSQAATLSGTATHLTLHTTTGILSAQASTITGSAAHQHAATGALAAQAATVAGSAAHLTLHATTGALSAQSSTIAGAAAHQHAATGALQAQSATIAGSADHTAAGSSHSTSGALSAQAATIAGSATHLTLHTTTGALSAQSATIAGAALHPHTTSGALQAQSATLAGTAAHATLHTTGGALSAQAATLSGAAAHEHASAGALAAQSATIAGTAVHAAAGVHIATGALQAGDASISGSAAAPIQRQVLGGWAKYRRQDRQERPDDEESTKTPQPNDTPVVEAVAPKQRIRGRIRIADIAARLAEQQQADADKLERQAVERARRKRRQQQEEELLLF